MVVMSLFMCGLIKVVRLSGTPIAHSQIDSFWAYQNMCSMQLHAITCQLLWLNWVYPITLFICLFSFEVNPSTSDAPVLDPYQQLNELFRLLEKEGNLLSREIDVGPLPLSPPLQVE